MWIHSLLFHILWKESKPTEPKFDGNESKVNQSNVNVSTTSKKGSNVSTSKVKSTNRSRSHVPASVDKSSSKLGRSVSKQRSGSLVALKNSSTSPRKSSSTKLNSSTRLTKMSNKNQSSKSVLAKSKKISTTPKAIILARTSSKTTYIIGICPTIPNRILTFVLYYNYQAMLEDQLYIYDTEQELTDGTLDSIYLDEMKPLKDKWPELYVQMGKNVSIDCSFPMAVVIHKPERVVISCSTKRRSNAIFHFKLDQPTQVSVIEDKFDYGSGITTWIDKSSMFYARTIYPAYYPPGTVVPCHFSLFLFNNDKIEPTGGTLTYQLFKKDGNGLKPEPVADEVDEVKHGYHVPGNNEIIPNKTMCGFIDSTTVRLILYWENPSVITFDRKFLDSITPRASEIHLGDKESNKVVKAEVKQYDLNNLIKFGKPPKSQKSHKSQKSQNTTNGRSTTIIASVTSLIVILCLCGTIVCFFIFYRKESKPNEPRLNENEFKVDQSNVNVSTTSKKGSHVSTSSKGKTNNRTTTSKRSQVPSRIDKSSSKLGRSVSKQRSGSLAALKNSSTSPKKSSSTKLGSSTRLTKMSNKNKSSKSVITKSKKISTTPKAIISARTQSKTIVIHKPERVLIGCSDKSDNTTVFHFKLDEPTKVSVIVSNDVFGFGITTWIDKSSMFYALNIQPQPIYSKHPVDKLTQFGTFELNNDQIHMVGKRFYFDLNDKNANSYVVKPESIQNEEVRELHGYNQPSKAELNVDTIVCGFVDSTSARIIMYSKNPPVITFDWKSIDSIKPRASEIDIHIEGKSTVKTKVKQYDLNKLIKFGKAPKSIFGRSTTIIASVTSLILILCLCGFIVCFFIFYRKESKPTEPRLDGNESKVNQSNVNVSTTSKKGSYVSTPSRSVSKQRSGSLIASKNRSAVRSKSHLTKCDSATRGDKALVKNITARKSSKTKLIGRNSSSKKGSQKSRSKTTK
ncbi:hypothetical protein RDWZM_004862 [Blomia tropicalis]|uniref:Uncharacterized protein n=1 Tax=Blomia tropicalis TaxID=40697 RepID=A0A9Q0M817_BLOTA|nr:hypothetical protein RDWZM_004862 [Blomia tropicalis]